MKATIEIKMDNAAFHDDDPTTDPTDAAGRELARMLRELAGRVDDTILTPGDDHILYDVNGNRVGTFTVTE